MRLWAVALESFRVCREGDVQGVGALLKQRVGVAVMNRGRCHEADARMAMAVVVPGEELLAVRACILDTAKARRKVGTIFEGLELRLGEGVVVRDIRAAVGFGDLKIHQQLGHRLGAHAGPAVGVQGELVRRDVLLGDGFGDQLLGQRRALLWSNHPADDIAAEDIEDHVQVKAGPFGRAFDLRDIPTPDFVGSGGQQLGFDVGRMGELMTSFTHRSLGAEQAIHGAHRAEITPLVEQGGIDGRRCAVGKPFAAQYRLQSLSLRVAERQWRCGSGGCLGAGRVSWCRRASTR